MQPNTSTTGRGRAAAKPARDRVFEVAADLFYRKGLHAVGVEEIVRDAGVSKISLYRNFASKDALIIAYLEHRSSAFLNEWDDAFGRYRDDPRAQLRAIMTYVAKRTAQDGYRGCPFINFSAEFPDPAHPGREIARATKRALRERFLELAEALRAPEPARLADGFLLLVEGAYGLSQTLGGGPAGSGRSLVWASELMVEAQLAASKPKTSKRRHRTLAKA